MSGITASAVTVFRVSLGIAALLVVLWIVGVISTPGANTSAFMTGVGDGIKWIFIQLGVLIRAL